MKKYAWLFLLAFAVTVAGCGDPCKDDVFTKLGDTVATIGKSGMEKDQVLAERGANRAAKCAESKASEMKKKMGL